MTAYKNRQTGCKYFEGSDAAMDSYLLAELGHRKCCCSISRVIRRWKTDEGKSFC